MKRITRGVLIATAIVSIAAILIWWRFGKNGHPASESVPSRAQGLIGAEGNASDAASRPLPSGPFDAIRGELEARARAGDAEAAYRIGHVLGRCREYQPIPGDVFVTWLAKMVAGFGDAMRLGDRPIGDDVNIDLLLYAKAEQDRICKGADALRGTVARGEAHVWIAQAAARGHPKAMAEYGDYAFEEFVGSAALLDHADEVAHRREQARFYLDAALRAGEPRALAAQAKAYGPAGYLGVNRTRSLAHWLAYRRTPDAAQMPASVLAMLDEQMRAGMDAASQDRAEALTNEIVAALPQRGGQP